MMLLTNPERFEVIADWRLFVCPSQYGWPRPRTALTPLACAVDTRLGPCEATSWLSRSSDPSGRTRAQPWTMWVSPPHSISLRGTVGFPQGDQYAKLHCCWANAPCGIRKSTHRNNRHAFTLTYGSPKLQRFEGAYVVPASRVKSPPQKAQKGRGGKSCTKD